MIKRRTRTHGNAQPMQHSRMHMNTHMHTLKSSRCSVHMQMRVCRQPLRGQHAPIKCTRATRACTYTCNCGCLCTHACLLDAHACITMTYAICKCVFVGKPGCCSATRPRFECTRTTTKKKHSRTHLFSHMCTRASTVCLLVHNPSYNAHACSSQATTCFNTTRASRARTQQVQALAHAHVNANARTRMLVADACITHSIL